MYYLAANNTINLDALLIIISIGVILAVGILLSIVLIKLCKTLSRVNCILKKKQADIERTIGNLPDMTENISDAAAEVREIATTVNNITGKVESTVEAVSINNIFAKIPGIAIGVKKAFEFVQNTFMKKDI